MLLLTGLLLPGKVIRAEEGNEDSSKTGSQEETAWQEEIQEIYPLCYDEWQGRSEDIIMLEEDEKEYRAAQRGYIRRRPSQYAGMETGDYSVDTPGSWTVGTISSGDAFANLLFSGEGFNKIACLIQDKKEETVLTTRDWEACTGKIRDYVEQYYGENVSDLTFEHYQMGQGEEVYLYSFFWYLELPDHPEVGRVGIRACMGLKLTEHIQAEFLGFASRYDIHGGVRYTTASFEEHVEEYDPETFTVNDSNMMILPEAEWELAGLYDPFAWLDEFFGSMLEEAAGTEPEPESVREGLIRKIERTGGRR